MDHLRVRAYNVRFGDAILVTVPDADDAGHPLDRHLLIDVGNALAMSGGQNDVFEPIFDDIVSETGGTIDLYVSTHEHLDHVQGMLYANQNLDTALTIRQIWLTASAEGDIYYDQHPDAKRKFEMASALISDIHQRLPTSMRDNWVETLLVNNGFAGANAVSSARTADCVDFLRTYRNPNGDPSPTAYVFRTDHGNGWPHPFREATLDVWAPEEDTSVYYGRFQPFALGVAAPGTADANATLESELVPPSGIDAEAFYNLVDMRTRGFWDSLLAIDRARNNSSVVFCLKWRGWRLLFPGDAEIRSYREMHQRGMLQPVHFLKVGHHGSHNGTPPDELLDNILPEDAADDRPRFALVSTADDTYSGVPDTHTLNERIAQRCSVTDTRRLQPGAFTDLLFPPQ